MSDFGIATRPETIPDNQPIITQGKLTITVEGENIRPQTRPPLTLTGGCTRSRFGCCANGKTAAKYRVDPCRNPNLPGASNTWNQMINVNCKSENDVWCKDGDYGCFTGSKFGVCEDNDNNNETNEIRKTRYRNIPINYKPSVSSTRTNIITSDTIGNINTLLTNPPPNLAPPTPYPAAPTAAPTPKSPPTPPVFNSYFHTLNQGNPAPRFPMKEAIDKYGTPPSPPSNNLISGLVNADNQGLSQHLTQSLKPEQEPATKPLLHNTICQYRVPPNVNLSMTINNETQEFSKGNCMPYGDALKCTFKDYCEKITYRPSSSIPIAFRSFGSASICKKEEPADLLINIYTKLAKSEGVCHKNDNDLDCIFNDYCYESEGKIYKLDEPKIEPTITPAPETN
jgi:hypothetical protein